MVNFDFYPSYYSLRIPKSKDIKKYVTISASAHIHNTQ